MKSLDINDIKELIDQADEGSIIHVIDYASEFNEGTIYVRDYGIGAQILRSFGLSKLCLLTNNPKKVVGLQGYGIQIVDQRPIIVPSNQYNKKYMKVKRDKLGHSF